MVTDRHGRGLQTGVHLELRQDALNVGPNGVATDAQPARDRSSVGPLHEQAEDLSLPRGELRDKQSDTVGRSAAMTCGNEAMGKDHLPTDDGFHRADEPSDRRVLREVAAESRLEGVIDGPRVIERGNGHELRLRPTLQHLLSNREAAAIGESDVHQDHICVVGLEERDRVTPIRHGSTDTHPGFVQGGADRLGEQEVIIDDQDANRGASLRSTGKTIWKSAPG